MSRKIFTETQIAFEYVKLLLEIKKDKEAREEGKIILLSLLNTKNWAYAALQLGKLEFNLGNIENARYYFNLLKERGNTKDKNCALLELGKLEFSIGNIMVAKNIFIELIKNGNIKDRYYAMLELGKLEFSQDNIEEAREYFFKLLDTPNKYYAMLELGKLEFSQGNIEKARNYFTNLLNAPNKYYAILELGKLEFSQGNVSKAKNYFTSLLNTTSWTHATLELAKLEYSRGNIDNAIKHFMILSNNTMDIYARLRAILNLIIIHIKQKNYIKAVEYLNNLKNHNKLSSDLISQVEILSLYLSKELNTFLKTDMETTYNYNRDQFLDYNYIEALEHIIGIHEKEFSQNINIYKLFEEIRSKLTNQYKVSYLDINDVYDIPYQYIGKNCHILRVVTLPDSKDILTMFPLDVTNFNLADELKNGNSLKLQIKK